MSGAEVCGRRESMGTTSRFGIYFNHTINSSVHRLKKMKQNQSWKRLNKDLKTQVRSKQLLSLSAPTAARKETVPL